ncbi:response regulator [Limnoglobus roseus]|uniref:Response regulator receiver domain n=1 Tax=Limnoglobus roseus TaxID=2598579 RepID=A0A5C1APE0_9BACT|nr:response regulator [Limnoglobus roseus]QEL20455.1 response regulator receiver domain [Limnoglobus roseus]
MLKATILIVEDEALIAEDLREQLEQLGHTVVGVVDTADEAIAATRQKSPGLVLMDIRLRGGADGVDAATMISEWSDVPIIYMTAHSDADTVARAMLVQPYGYVVKPVRDSDLVTAIQTALLRHAAEARLRAFETEARRIVENTADLVLQILPDGRMMSSNPAGRTALGYSPSQLCRLNFRQLVADSHGEAVPQLLSRAAEVDGDTQLQLTLAARDGRRIPVKGVVGRRQLGGRVDRLWVVLHPIIDANPASTQGSNQASVGGEVQPAFLPTEDAIGPPVTAACCLQPAGRGWNSAAR